MMMSSSQAIAMNIEHWQIHVFCWMVMCPTYLLIRHRKQLIAEWKEHYGKKPVRVHVSRIDMKRRRLIKESERIVAEREALASRIATVPIDIRQHLYAMVNGDRNVAMRLVSYEKTRNQGRDETYYWQAAIERLVRDRH